MTYKRMKVGVSVGFVSITLMILALFVPISTMLFALIIGFFFVLPIVALVSILILGASMVSKKPKKSSKLEKEDVVISTN